MTALSSTESLVFDEKSEDEEDLSLLSDVLKFEDTEMLTILEITNRCVTVSNNSHNLTTQFSLSILFFESFSH